MSTTDIAAIIGIVKDAITGGAACTAAVIAAKGLKTWKRQLHGTANYDVARRLLRALYSIRENVRAVRSPFMMLSEMTAALKAKGKDVSSESVVGEEGAAAAYDLRWRRVSEALAQFSSEVLEAEALWDSNIRERAEDVFRCTGELHFTLTRWVSQPNRQLTPEQDFKVMDIVYEDYTTPSDFTAKLNAVILGVEAEVRSRLRQH